MVLSEVRRTCSFGRVTYLPGAQSFSSFLNGFRLCIFWIGCLKSHNAYHFLGSCGLLFFIVCISATLWVLSRSSIKFLQCYIGVKTVLIIVEVLHVLHAELKNDCWHQSRSTTGSDSAPTSSYKILQKVWQLRRCSVRLRISTLASFVCCFLSVAMAVEIPASV